MGSGIGGILLQGLKTVADKGSQLVKKEAKNHGSKIATSVHKKGHQLLTLRSTTAKHKLKSTAAKRMMSTQCKLESAKKSMLKKRLAQEDRKKQYNPLQNRNLLEKEQQ